jgi:glycerol uptake facilitator-like aquaporin
MNPARTLGPAVASMNFSYLWLYFLAPCLGACAAVALYSYIFASDADNNRKNLKKSVIR